MTEKRFTIAGDRSISDHQKKRLYDLSDFDGVISINECLNELHEENKDLEEARSYYQENFLTMKTERHQFKEENEQFKQLCDILKEKIQFYEDQVVNPECPICHTILRKISIDHEKDRYYRKCPKCGYEREESLI